MKKSIFTGAAVALVTPMYEDGSVNYEELGRIIEFQIENKTDAIVICGTTGESACLSHEEHCKVMKYAIEKVNKRIPVIAGTGSNDTAYAIKLSMEAEKMGADAILSVTPYYNKTSQEGLYQHFTAIADKVNIPIILYNVPSRTGCNIKPETYARLAKHPNIAAVKEANGDISSVAKTISLCGDDLDVYSGNDDQVIAMMALGAKGVISVFSNFMPKECHDMCQSFFDGNIEKARDMQLKYLEIMDIMFSDVNPIPVKETMNLLGYKCGPCRLPLVSMSESGLTNLKNCLKKYNLID